MDRVTNVLFVLMTIVCASAVLNNVCLRQELAATKTQLDFYTCRVQYEPTPIPEQTSDSPTLIEDEPDHPSIEAEIAAETRMPAGVVGSPVQDLRAEYASDYRRGQKIKHAECDHCEGCGITEAEAKEQGGQLNDHHKKSVKRIFQEGLPTSLIGDPKNLIRLCRNCGDECHFRIGHDPDGPDGPLKPTWSESNPNVERDAKRNLMKVKGDAWSVREKRPMCSASRSVAG